MAPVDPTTCARLRVGYEGPFGTHTMVFHKKPAADSEAFLTEVIDVLELMAKLMFVGAKFLDAFYALAGSPIFNPIVFTPINSTGSVSPDLNSDPSAFLQFGGRGADGRRVKLYLFESGFQPRADMRYEAGENADIDAVLDALNSETSTIGTISGSAPIWKPYANFGSNDYLVHKARRG